jgi:hypothetical protein
VVVDQPFSTQLEDWLRSDGPKTIGDLSQVFAAKSFAVTILLLMFVPALPLPTGGVTHVCEAITVLLGAQMVIGVHTLWLPARWKDRPFGARTTEKAIPFMVKRIRWFERFSRPRWAEVVGNAWFLRLLGLVIIGLAVAAALAPPFSGLDTLPSMGVVAIALGIILGDMLVVGIGAALGAGGVLLILTVGAALFRLLKDLL